MRLKQIIGGTDPRWGKTFALAIHGLILISVITFSVETLPDLSQGSRTFLYWIEVVTVVIFTLEYLLRLALTSHRTRFAFSFFGIVDLLAILPFWLNTAIDLRAIRVVRMLRLIRILKLGRYSLAAQRFQRAFAEVKEELLLFLGTAALLLFVSSVGIYYFERDAQPKAFASVFHAMWWSLATLTTVGYGDVYPVTVGGKIFTGVILVLSLGLIAVPSGLLAAAMTQVARSEREKDLET